MKIVIKELLNISDLIKAQDFYIHKLTDIVIVNKNNNFIFTTLQVLALSLKNFNNSQKPLVANFVTDFGKDYFFKKKDYKILLINFRHRRIWNFGGLYDLKNII